MHSIGIPEAELPSVYIPLECFSQIFRVPTDAREKR